MVTTAVVPAEAARPTSASDGGGGGASSQERSRVCAELAAWHARLVDFVTYQRSYSEKEKVR